MCGGSVSKHNETTDPMFRKLPLPTLRLALALLLAVLTAPVQGGLLDTLTGKAAEREPLRAEQAFPFSAKLVSPQEIRASFTTLPGYYLYKDKLKFELVGSEARIIAVELPEGITKDDPYFGRLQVIYGPMDATLRLDRPLSGTATLRAGYQGCADEGLCYPPETAQAVLAASAAGAAAATAPTPSAAAPADGGDLAQLLAGGNTWLMLAGFFGAGLLLAFTACLYPMIPILSGLIAGDHHRRSGGRAFLLSLVYVEATAVTYAIAGVLAGLSGIAVQANLQSPWALGAFAALFVLLALSMFGFYNLQLPSRWQTKLSELSRHQRGGSFIGVAIMGALSALIVGACSGPALVAALAFIGSTGDYALGGLALFAMANGMGLPLLLVGTAAGKWLPHGGHWMNTIKKVFGVGFLMVALWLVERLIPAHLALALWGALLLGCAVYLGAFDHLTLEAGGLVRARKFGGVLLLIWGSLLLLGAAAGGHNFWQPLSPFNRPAAASPALEFQPVRSVAELDAALAQAKAQARPVMLDVYADWCVYCVQLERATFPAPEVRQALSGAQLLRVDVTRMSDEDKALLERLKVFLPPAVIFYDSRGVERADQRVSGFLEPAPFAERARRALGGAL